MLPGLQPRWGGGATKPFGYEFIESFVQTGSPVISTVMNAGEADPGRIVVIAVCSNGVVVPDACSINGVPVVPLFRSGTSMRTMLFYSNVPNGEQVTVDVTFPSGGNLSATVASWALYGVEKDPYVSSLGTGGGNANRTASLDVTVTPSIVVSSATGDENGASVNNWTGVTRDFRTRPVTFTHQGGGSAIIETPGLVNITTYCRCIVAYGWRPR